MSVMLITVIGTFTIRVRTHHHGSGDENGGGNDASVYPTAVICLQVGPGTHLDLDSGGFRGLPQCLDARVLAQDWTCSSSVPFQVRSFSGRGELVQVKPAPEDKIRESKRWKRCLAHRNALQTSSARLFVWHESGGKCLGWGLIC
eukprot:2192495-Rhodomonas_salina.5